jgi:thiosulfate/3-mercaptopyruvate sulfurtransferase
MTRIAPVLLATVALAACGTASTQEEGAEVLVSTEWLAENLDEESLVLLHVGMGHDAMPEEVIPGATFLDYHTIAVDADELSTEVPPVPDLEGVFRSVGVSNDNHVVVYGSGSAHLAARVFMTLEYLGHRGRVSVLDGGFEMWTREARPTSSQQRERAAGSFVAEVREDVLMTADAVAASLENARVTLIDARPENEYTGERVVGRNPRGGHIPGAYNLYWEDLLISREEPRLKDLSAVRTRFEEAGATEDGVVVSYCQIGMRASYTYLISRHLGYDARFYDGSWMEWSRVTSLPAVQGASPR